MANYWTFQDNLFILKYTWYHFAMFVTQCPLNWNILSNIGKKLTPTNICETKMIMYGMFKLCIPWRNDINFSCVTKKTRNHFMARFL